MVRNIDGVEYFDENDQFSVPYDGSKSTPLEGVQWRDFPNVASPTRPLWEDNPDRYSSGTHSRERVMNNPPRGSRQNKFITEGEGGDYLGGIDWGKLRPGVEAQPNDVDVSQQFLNRINPILDRSRNRPLPSSYIITHTHPMGRVSSWGGADPFNSTLWHEDKATGNVRHVGHVNWDGDSGFVNGLSVDLGHRHMTMKLLQEAHDSARSVNAKYEGSEFHGPATSNEINSNSGPIVRKYNPESESFKTSRYAYENHPDLYTGDEDDYNDEGESDEDRWERLSDEAYENNRSEYGAPCTTCDGAGMSRLVAVSGHQKRPSWMSHVSRLPGEVEESRSLAFKEVGCSTTYAWDSEGNNDHEFEQQHPNYGRIFHKDYPSLNGYTRIAPWDLPSRNQDVQTWVKRCTTCSNAEHPGFPNASSHADAPSYHA